MPQEEVITSSTDVQVIKDVSELKTESDVVHINSAEPESKSKFKHHFTVHTIML